MAKERPRRILEDVPRPSTSSVMEAFYSGAADRKRTRELPIELVDANPDQPRRRFDSDELAALTDSIRELGLIQAIAVRPLGDRYQIICGERRWRACKALGLTTIRVEVHDVDDAVAYKLALAENIQRNSLQPIEEALAYQQLVKEGTSQAEVARSLGVDRRRVSEKLLLLELPEEAQELLSARADTFSERHARLLAQAIHQSPLDAVSLARRCAEGGWSTRRLENEIARAQHPPSLTTPRLFENLHYALNKRGGFTLTVRARSSQEVARTISELDEKLRALREAFANELSARADTEERGPIEQH